MKKAVIMCRVSSDEQAKGFSLDIQKEQLTNYCNRNNITIVNEYKEDHSAKNFNRPEFQRFLSSIKKNKGNIDVLLITSWDRFSRNLTDALVMIRKLNQLGIQVQAIEQPIDMSIPENKAMLALYLAIPEIDNDRRSIKIRGGVRASLKAGRWARMAPVGYKNTRDSSNKPIVIPSEKAKHIQFAFKSFAEGKLQSDILTDLRKKGVTISRSNLSKQLRNPFYIGKIIIPKMDNEPMKIIDGLHESIISDALYFKVQDILNGKSAHKISSYVFQREEFPLRGILRCHSCNSLLTASKSKSCTGRRYSYYHCNYCKTTRFSSDKLNTFFEDLLSDFKFTKSSIALYELMMKEQFKNSGLNQNSNIETVKSNLKEIELRIQKLQDLFVDGDIEKDHFQQTSERYAKTRQDLLRTLESQNSVSNEYQKWLKSGIHMLYDIKNHYLNSQIAEKQKLISSIFPENFYFDGEKCRTTRINDVLRCILQIDNDLGDKKSGQFSKKLELSTLVESPRIELGSKQAIKELSTRLFSDWVFVSLLGQKQPQDAYLLKFS